MQLVYDANGHIAWLATADAAIKAEETVCFDVAAEHGQMFHNVKHMSWFRRAVAEELGDTIEDGANV